MQGIRRFSERIVRTPEGMGEGFDIPLPDSNMVPGMKDAVAEGGSDTIKSGRNSIDTPINSGVSKPRDVATPNPIDEQMNPDGIVKSRAFYDENGNQFSRQDFVHRHFDKKSKPILSTT